jgi:endonuclease/exonuclease/phosphatase family metal-dependent hydrolase
MSGGRACDGFRRMQWGALLVALLVVGLSACRSAGSADRVDVEATMDVVTLNLWHDREDWPRREALIASELERLAPDVVLLQEVLQDKGLPNQAETLARRLGYAWHFVSVDPPERARRYGNAILTRESPVARGEKALRPMDDYRIAGWVRTAVHGRPVNIYVVHLNFTDASGAIRTQQIADLQSFIEGTRGDAPVMLAGDFNTRGDSPELAPLRERYDDAYAYLHGPADDARPERVTLNPKYHERPQRIDLIFAQRDRLLPLESRRILDQPDADGTWPSDHFGTWARLRFAATR